MGVRAAGGADLSTWYVIQAVMWAEVVEQLCRAVDVAVDAPAAGAALSAAESCVQVSEGQVAVAFRLRPAADLL